MRIDAPKSTDSYNNGRQVCGRYGISDMTLYRWERSASLCFPKPIRINGRRYWRERDLSVFEMRQFASDVMR